MAAVLDRPVSTNAMQTLRKTGNPFRNYFARHPDDDVCSRYHVAELYAREREQLLAVVDLYRHDPKTHSEIVPILGNKGAGKTHLLHSLKHGPTQGWQLVVTPGTYQKGTDFPEYVLFQIIDTLLTGGKQKGKRPIEYIGEELTRRYLRQTLEAMPANERSSYFGTASLARWVRKLGLGQAQAEERCQWLIETISKPNGMPIRQACQEAQLDCSKMCDAIAAYVDAHEPRATLGQMRRRIIQGFVMATLLNQETVLADFLTDGFARLDFQVRPSRQDLVLSLFKALMDMMLMLKVPVVVAFDQLEDLLLVRRTEDAHKVSESFFAGIVQLMHRIDGLCFLVFAERGLWNRFVPSLDGYIQDRLNNPIHLEKYGTIKALRLEPPAPYLVWQVVAARLKPALEELAGEMKNCPAIYPFSEEQIARVAKTEPTLRDMLQQFRHLFDTLVYGTGTVTMIEQDPPTVKELPSLIEMPPQVKSVVQVETPANPVFPPMAEQFPPVAQRIHTQDAIDLGLWPAVVKTTTEAAKPMLQPVPMPVNVEKPVEQTRPLQKTNLLELWKEEVASAKAKLSPEGALTGASRELQTGLGSLLNMCHEHGVKIGPWRLTHVVQELNFGDHPTYGVLSLAHWAGKAGKTWRLGIGLFLGRGPGKPRDLAVKLNAFDGEPCVLDQLILLRPSDDTSITGKSKTLWDEAAGKGQLCRLESLDLDRFAWLYAFPRWLSAITESQEGQPLPNLADFLQDHLQPLIQQLCLPGLE
ncbi:MAG: hypothetical protein QM703_19915 [Gemmatales bacterium]